MLHEIYKKENGTCTTDRYSASVHFRWHNKVTKQSRLSLGIFDNFFLISMVTSTLQTTFFYISQLSIKTIVHKPLINLRMSSVLYIKKIYILQQ